MKSQDGMICYSPEEIADIHKIVVQARISIATALVNKKKLTVDEMNVTMLNLHAAACKLAGQEFTF